VNDRCECHECTQARWKTSIQGQIAGLIEPRMVRTRDGLVADIKRGLMGVTLTADEATQIITEVRYATHGDIPCLK
jgi:hypothetical protein